MVVIAVPLRVLRHAALGLTPLLLAGCSAESAGGKSRAVPTQSASLPSPGEVGTLVAVETTTVEVPLTLPAQLYVERDAPIYARSAGVVEAILVDLGSRVAAGQLLARLESADQAIALAQAEERVAMAKQRVERQRALAAAGVVTPADSEEIEFEFREATLALKKARREEELTRIVAPFGGVVTSRTARVGRLVAAGDSLFRVTALAPVLLSVRVPEASASELRVGTDATVLGPRGERARARVVRGSPVVDAASGTRELVLQLVGGDRLTPGSNVSVKLGSDRRRVVAVPREAIARGGYALVWDERRVTSRPVVLGSELAGGRVEVVSGLAPGEKVLRSPQ